MECINCHAKMKLQKSGRMLHETKKREGMYKIRVYECPDCGYTETVYGSMGIDTQRINNYNKKDE